MEHSMDDSQDLQGQRQTENGDSVEDGESVAESADTALSSPSRKQFMMAMNSSLQSIDPDSLLRPVQQTISCSGGNKQPSFSVYGNDVTVHPSTLNTANNVASNKIRISQVCKFDWEQRYYYGNLVACNKTYVAYVVGVKTNPAEHIRVINHQTSSRVLLKGFNGKVTDIKFGGPDENNLACMDMIGNLRIFLLEEDDGILKFDLVLEVFRPNPSVTEFSLVSWSPVVPFDDDDDEEHDLMVAVSHNENIKVYSIRGNRCSFHNINNGIKSIDYGHTKPVTCMVVSPNLEVLATSSLDGYVKFWDVNIENSENPSCLHEWQPHDGKPVMSLFFCDNQLAHEDDGSSSWRFLITCATYNTEVKVWCAVSWKCLQVLRFDSMPGTSLSADNPGPCLKAVLDKSAKYFLITDIKRQVLYLLQLYQDSQEGTAHFTSLTECILTQPMLNFSLYDTKATKAAQENDSMNENENEDHDDEDDEDDEHDRCKNGFGESQGHEERDDNNDNATGETPRAAYSVSVKLFAIHSKALQKLHVKYTPCCSVPPPTPSVCTAVSSDDPMSVRDAMSDIAEGQGSLTSDLEDADSFTTANLKVQEFIDSVQMHDSIHSSVSTVTEVSAMQSAEISMEASRIGEEAEESKLDTKIPVSDREEKEENCVAKDDDAVSNAGELSKKASSNEADRVLNEEQSAKPRSGTYIILKRPNRETNDSDKANDQESAISSQDSDSQTRGIRPESKHRSEKPRGRDPDAMNRLLLEQVERKQIADEKKKQNAGQFDPFNDDVDASRSFVSQSSSSITVETGDLLGLGSAGDSSKKEENGGRENESDLSTESHEKDRLSRSNSSTSENLKNGKAPDLDRLMSMLQHQYQHMIRLTETVNDLGEKLQQQTEKHEQANKRQSEEREQMKTFMQSLQKNSGTNLNRATREISKACSQRLDTFTTAAQNTQQQSQEKQMQALLQAVNTSISGKLEKLVKSEIKSSVLPSVQRLVVAAMDQSSNFVAEKLATIEKTLNEEVGRLVKSKSVAETIGFTAATILEGTLPNAYREAFQNILIPSYEAACKEMFNQINNAFEKGTKTYFNKLDSHFESRKQRQMEQRDPVLAHLQGLVQTLENTADRLTGSESNLELLMKNQFADAMAISKTDLLASFDQKISKSFVPSFQKGMESMLGTLKEDLNDSIKSIGAAQFGAAQFGATPVESSYIESNMERINRHLENLEYESAFDIALNAADLAVVLHICQRVEPEDLFPKYGSVLNQPMILSLIQQLSADLANDTEVKVSYLFEASGALDQTNDITKEHSPALLASLQEQVNKAMLSMKQNDPDNHNIKHLKFLNRVIGK